MSNVIQIDAVRITRAQRTYQPSKECQHLYLTFSDHGEIIECDECHKQVTAYWALTMLAEVYGKAWAKMEAGQRRLAEAKEKDISLLAAQRVEKAWRSRTMVPACPHCSEPIFPQDGFGGMQINREMALRRRVATQEASARQAPPA